MGAQRSTILGVLGTQHAKNRMKREKRQVWRPSRYMPTKELNISEQIGSSVVGK